MKHRKYIPLAFRNWRVDTDRTHYYWSDLGEKPKEKIEKLFAFPGSDLQPTKVYYKGLTSGATYCCCPHSGSWYVKIFFLGNGKTTVNSKEAYEYTKELSKRV